MECSFISRKGWNSMERFFCLLTGYICGNFLTAELIAYKKTGGSAASIGTGNPGMANIMEQLGFRYGIYVLLGDLAKTILACVLGYFIGSGIGHIAMLYAGVGCVTGHNFPVWKRFRGGKGVSCTCMAITIFLPAWGLMSCAAGMFGVLLSQSLPLGGVLITTFYLFPAFLAGGREAGFLALVLEILMVSRHFPGLVLLFKGEGTKVDVLGKLRGKVKGSNGK